MKIAIISHTEHYKNKDGAIVGWGPTINEINHLLEIAENVVHIAPFYESEAPLSALQYTSNAIEFVPLKSSGGRGFDKSSILFTAPYNLIKIRKAIKNVDYVQFRAPTGMGIYVLPFLKFFNIKKYWIKYAGNWKDENMPFGNKVQKIWLQKILSNKVKVTVNGSWENERENILPFQNPCLDKQDRVLGLQIVNSKRFEDKLDFCFVGGLNEHKGVYKVIAAFSNINTLKIGTLHFVGDGVLKNKYEKLAKKINCDVIFHGAVPKNDLKKIYKKSHYILLPSKSEGFPKVIGEAMNFGCIPIVSNVSCINQYITNNKNGFLISPNTVTELENKIKVALSISPNQFKVVIEFNYKKASIFTYSHYNNLLLAKVLK